MSDLSDMDGALVKRGMVGWSSVMPPDEIQSIRAYFISEAQAYKAQQDKTQPPTARIQQRRQAGRTTTFSKKQIQGVGP